MGFCHARDSLQKKLASGSLSASTTDVGNFKLKTKEKIVKKTLVPFVLALALLTPTLNSQAADQPAEKAAEGKKEAKAKFRPFHGKIKEADKRAQSIVLDGEKAQMFLITSETRLSKEGKPATFDELTAGETVGGRAQEKDGKWEAVAINIGKPPVKATKTKQLEEKPEAK